MTPENQVFPTLPWSRAIGPDNGRRPPFATPIQEGLGRVGTGDGYSGQEYDGAGQEHWRTQQERRNLPADGKVRGSGAGAGGGDSGEDFDIATPGGAAPAGTSQTPTKPEPAMTEQLNKPSGGIKDDGEPREAGDQQAVKNQSVVKPEDYPEPAAGETSKPVA